MDLSACPFADQPYALKSSEERKRRAGLRDQPLVKALSDFVDDLSARHPDYQLPDFDPCDGGVNARVLLLLEAPGRKAIESGFVSRNNPDPRRVICASCCTKRASRARIRPSGISCRGTWARKRASGPS